MRELENAVESMVALSCDGEVDVSLLPGAVGNAPPDAVPEAPGARLSLKQRLDAYERGLIVAALEEARGNRSETARLLGIGRATSTTSWKYGLGDEP